MIISLHMPKTAGNSFLNALNKKYGPHLKQDYGDMARIQEYLAGQIPAESVYGDSAAEKNELDKVNCIHGHFLAQKYNHLLREKRARLVTWLRDPVERLISHYNFFILSYDPLTAGPLFKKVIEESWTLEKFCFSEEFKNLYSKYLQGFPREYIEFIGITEYYSDDLRWFSRMYLNKDVPVSKINCAPKSMEASGSIDPGFRRAVESFHIKDAELYKYALEKRNLRG